MWLDKHKRPYLAKGAEADLFIECYAHIMDITSDSPNIWCENSTTCRIIDILPPKERILLLTKVMTGLLCPDVEVPANTLGNGLAIYSLFSLIYLTLSMECDMRQDDDDDEITWARDCIKKTFREKHDRDLDVSMDAPEQLWVDSFVSVFEHLLPPYVSVLLDNQFEAKRNKRFWKTQRRANREFFSDVVVRNIGDFYYVVPKEECSVKELTRSFYCHQIISYHQAIYKDPIKELEATFEDIKENFEQQLSFLHEYESQYKVAYKEWKKHTKVHKKACTDPNMDAKGLEHVRKELGEAQDRMNKISRKRMDAGKVLWGLKWMFSGSISWRAKWKELGGQSDDVGKRISVFLSRKVQTLIDDENESGLPDVRSINFNTLDANGYYKELSRMDGWSSFVKDQLKTDEEKESDNAKFRTKHQKLMKKIFMKCATCGRGEKVHACSACECVYYCSTVCQKRDWKEHKKTCSK